MWPKGWLTPPCAGGELRLKYKSGLITKGPWPQTIQEDDMAILTNDEQVELQRFLANLESIDSNVSYVKYTIPWFRQWSAFEPADFEAAGECECSPPAEEVVTIVRDVTSL
jgi:hypothetical protein